MEKFKFTDVIILLVPVIVLVVCLVYNLRLKAMTYIELLDECADMYPNHFEEMCLGK